MITKRYKLYKNFGKCLEISNGTVKALVTVDIGPRVIYYGFKGANMFYEDVDRLVDKGGDFFDKNFKEGEKWYLYGGHRIWKAEEDLLSYVPDNYPVRVDRLENGALFTPALQKLTSLQQTMKVTMDEDGTLTVEESLRNEGSEPVELSVWGLSVLRQGGTEIIPLNTADTGLLPQQNMVFWPYNDKKDKRFSVNEKYAVLKQRRTVERAFKLGIFNHAGWAAYHYGKYLLIKKFAVRHGRLPDFQCNFETYTNDKIIEMEVLSPVQILNPGESAVQEEKFTVYEGVKLSGTSDDDIDRLLMETKADV
ncbi:MAG: hypothetical protein ACI4MW_04710 [Christensenellales bacterium]